MKHLLPVALLAALTGLLLPTTARAFMCTVVSEDGPSIYWQQRTVYYTLDENGTADIAGDHELTTLREAFDTWNAVTCSDLKFVESGEEYNGKVGFDYLEPANNQNALLFRDNDWPYSSLIIALTTVTVNNCTGQILDADIEFNSKHYKFTNSDQLINIDLKNTAVHEIGHFFGLDHTTTTDNVMYPYAAPGETRCRELFDDDIQAICYRYPTGAATQYCYDNDNCKDNCRAPENCDYDVTTVVENVGCQSTDGASTSVALLIFMFLIFLDKSKNYSR